MFDKVSIIGCGLIGSSILRAIKEKKISKITTVFDKSKEVLSFLKQKKIDVEIQSNINLAVKNSDFVIIATPLSSYKEILLDQEN